jgi:acetyl esterase
MSDATFVYLDARGPYVTGRPNPPGRSVITESDPGFPIYQLLSELRSPVSLRELMILPVRTGYIGKPGDPPPAHLPPSAAALFPEVVTGEISVRCEEGTIHCRTYSLPGIGPVPKPVILYLHGGGFTVGTSADTAAITSRLARDTGALVVSADYRMAPEWPFPYAVEDAFSVYRGLQEEAGLLGADGQRIVVAGDSAGGNLAAVLPLVARDRDVACPAATVLLCPITNFCAEEHSEFERLAARGIVYDTAFFGFIRGAYLQKKANWVHPYASPVCGDLAGYPPTMVVGGGEDPIIGDNRAFVEALRSAGVTANLYERAGMPHGYYFFPGLVPEGGEAMEAVAKFLLSLPAFGAVESPGSQ